MRGTLALLLVLTLAGCQAAGPPPPQPPLVLPPTPPAQPVFTRKVITALDIDDEVIEAMAAYFRFAFEEAEHLRHEGKHPLPSALYLSLPGHTDPDDELLGMLSDYHAHFPGPPYRRVLPLTERPWQSPEIGWTLELERMEWMGSENDILFTGGLKDSRGRLTVSWAPEFLLVSPGHWVRKK